MDISKADSHIHNIVLFRKKKSGTGFDYFEQNSTILQ